MVITKRKDMKLNLLFIVMDLLTVLAHPIVYAYGKFRPFAKSEEAIPLANRSVAILVKPSR
jgi:hypothetical protein